MRNIKLTIEYDGSRYYGWQRQPNLPTIQGNIENALKKITHETVEIHGSGRTDRGVHASGQVANFMTNTTIKASKFMLALNSLLPDDISIKESVEVNKDFHSRFSVQGKKYKYIIYNDKVRSPLNRLYTYHVHYDLDIDTMINTSKELIGTLDFKAFMASGGKINDTVRTIYDIKIERNNKFIEIILHGNGFLYNMVRIIVGTLIDKSRKVNTTSIKDILQSKDRTVAGHTAPPQGLYLHEVIYK